MSEMPSMPPRRANRLVAIQFLYAWDMSDAKDQEGQLAAFFSAQDLYRPDFEFAEDLIHGAILHKPSIDEKIRQYSQNWDFDRIAKIDLAILRLATYELYHCKDIPPIVSINEAIDLTKMLSDADSKRFVNGILDKIKEELDRPLRERAE